MTELMDLPTLWAAVADTARTRPELPFLAIPPRAVREYNPEGLLWSYGEVAERVTRLIERYTQAGYGHGHRVSLVLENRPEFMLHFLALNALGCWVVPLNPEYRHDDLGYVLGHSEVDLIVSLPHHMPAMHEVVTSLGRRIPVTDATVFADTLAGAVRPGRNTPPGREFRKRSDVHVRHDGHAQGLHHQQRVFLLRGRAVSVCGRNDGNRARCGTAL